MANRMRQVELRLREDIIVVYYCLIVEYGIGVGGLGD
jgi:hypothetical protein